MKTWLTSLFLLGAVAAPSIAQQTPTAERTPAELVEQLGADEFTVRRDAEIALETMGADAIEALKSAVDHDDPEVQWRAERLLQRIEADSAKTVKSAETWALPPLWRPGDLTTMFGSVFDRLEDDFGFDVPRRSFFNDPFFGDLRAQMRSFEQRARDAGGVAAGAGGNSQALEMRIGPEGVRVEVREQDGDGESSVETYEAPDLETFRDKYPEVARNYLGHDGDVFTWRLDPSRFLPGLPVMGSPVPGSVDPGRTLGVSVRPVGSDLRAFLGLDATRGLLVERVVPDSLAARLGIEPRDVVLAVENVAVGSVRDVRRALEAADSHVTVRVNRKGTEHELAAEHDWTAVDAKGLNGV